MLAARHRARLTMQYPNIDLQEGRRLRNVRRRLFQDDEVDTGRRSGIEDNLANCFFEEARKNRENAKQRWNFDFEKEEPLPGRYEWVKLDQDRNEIRNPLESCNRVENIQAVQKDDHVTIAGHSEDKDDENMTDST
ncbi:cyclin-dependent kinase inhibitor 2-like isoform X3 [Colletes gigas]|uniref:cyclin-dependent kinase inhibitor 2-like isoform X3 n=1 Tax=Colletes gigas TaxID=935657 RepID=UPI001C9A912E|nr:cyclin-dependent kinase inhibitor 2-like isoform X3 [Colletes gigas]